MRRVWQCHTHHTLNALTATPTRTAMTARPPDHQERPMTDTPIRTFSTIGCRKHLLHTDILLGDSEPSYYDPVWVRCCSRCGQDRTAFPGAIW